MAVLREEDFDKILAELSAAGRIFAEECFSCRRSMGIVLYTATHGDNAYEHFEYGIDHDELKTRLREASVRVDSDDYELYEEFYTVQHNVEQRFRSLEQDGAAMTERIDG